MTLPMPFLCNVYKSGHKWENLESIKSLAFLHITNICTCFQKHCNLKIFSYTFPVLIEKVIDNACIFQIKGTKL